MPKLSIYNYGKLGVNVDSAPASDVDGQLAKAQNAIHDPLGGDGALRNRPGLGALNGSAAAGSILGGIGVPLFDETSATRTFYYGTYLTLTGEANGWGVSTNAWTSASSIYNSTPANPVEALPNGAVGYACAYDTSTIGHPGCIFNNRLIYQGNNYTMGTTAPSIRSFDGVVDEELCKIPANPDFASGAFPSLGVLSMIAGQDVVYFSTLDGAAMQFDPSGAVSSVYELTPSTKALRKLGASFSGDYIPYALTTYLDRVWAGTFQGFDTIDPRIYYMRPGVDTTWTNDKTCTGMQGVLALQAFNGNLYAGCLGQAGTADGVILQRTATGTWSSVDTATHTGINAGGGYYSLVVFNNNLYASSRRIGALPLIRKFTGSAWSTVYTGVSEQREYANAYVHNGVLYMASGSQFNVSTASVISTPDGTTWTSKANPFNLLLIGPTGIFGAVVT